MSQHIGPVAQDQPWRPLGSHSVKQGGKWMIFLLSALPFLQEPSGEDGLDGAPPSMLQAGPRSGRFPGSPYLIPCYSCPGTLL